MTTHTFDAFIIIYHRMFIFTCKRHRLNGATINTYSAFLAAILKIWIDLKEFTKGIFHEFWRIGKNFYDSTHFCYLHISEHESFHSLDISISVGFRLSCSKHGKIYSRFLGLNPIIKEAI